MKERGRGSRDFDSPVASWQSSTPLKRDTSGMMEAEVACVMTPTARRKIELERMMPILDQGCSRYLGP